MVVITIKTIESNTYLCTHSIFLIFVSKLREGSPYNIKCNEGTCTVQFIKELDTMLGIVLVEKEILTIFNTAAVRKRRFRNVFNEIGQD